MKKQAVGLLAALAVSLCGGSVFADTGVGASIDGSGMLTVRIVSDAAESQLYTIYTAERNTVFDDEGGTADIDGLYALEQVRIVPEQDMLYNTQEVRIQLSDSLAGDVLKIVAGGGELSGETVYAVYPSGLSAAVAELRGASASEVDAVLRKYQETAWMLDLDRDTYKSYRTAVINSIVEQMKTVDAAEADVTAVFDTACALTELANCGQQEVSRLLLRGESLFRLTYTDVVRAQSSSFAQAFVNLRSDATENPLLNIEDLSALLRRAEALAVLNEAQRDNLLTVLNEYNDVFGLEFSGRYQSIDSYELVKRMAAESGVFQSVADVKNTFDSIVNTLYSTGSGSDGGRGQSGGSGGGGNPGGYTGGGIAGGGITGSVLTSAEVEALNETQRFLDIADALWAEPYITYMQDRKIMVGDGNGNVRPNDAVTREEFLKLLIEALQPAAPEELAEPAFVDVEMGAWYEDYVTEAVSLGIVKGISETEFGVGDSISREDAAVMIYRTTAAEQKILAETAEPMTFTDEADIADYALPAVRALQMAEVLSGYESGEYLPKNPVTRAEAAKMIYSVLKCINEL